MVVTIPEKNIPDLPSDLFAGVPATWWSSTPATTTLGSATAASPGSRTGSPKAAGSQQQLGRPVVKAFNNIYAKHLLDHGKPTGTRGGSRCRSRATTRPPRPVVMQLIDELGFDPVDAGGLDESWRQQPGTPVYAKDFDAEGVRRALAEASPERKAEWRATANSPGNFVTPA